MAKIIAISNQKGGVGKTTTAINLSVALGIKGFKVLLVDMDPQGNSTKGVGLDPDMLSHSVYDLILKQCNAKESIHKTEFGIDIIPAKIDLAMADFQLATSNDRKHHRLKYALDQIEKKYDYVLIDCPPSLGLLNMNALVAAKSVIVPVQCEYYALDGLISLLSTISKIQSALNKKLVVEGVLINMYDSRTKLHNEISIEIRKYFKESVYETAIPRSIKVPSSQQKKKPISYFDKSSSVTIAFDELANEVINGNKSK